MSAIQPYPKMTTPSVYALDDDQTAKYDKLLAEVSSWDRESSDAVKDGLIIGLSDRMYLTRECLLRALSADKWVVPTAIKRLRETLLWRQRSRLDDLRASREGIEVELNSASFLLVSFSPAGLPLVYMRPSTLPKEAFESPEKIARMLVWVVERGVDLMVAGVEEVAVTCDLRSPIEKSRRSIAAYQTMLSDLQQHYPGRLGWANLVNMGMMGKIVLNLVWPFIDEYTRSKIMTDARPSTTPRITPSTYLSQYGGALEFEYDPAKYWTELAVLCEARRKENLDRWIDAGGKIGVSEMEFLPPLPMV